MALPWKRARWGCQVMLLPGTSAVHQGHTIAAAKLLVPGYQAVLAAAAVAAAFC